MLSTQQLRRSPGVVLTLVLLWAMGRGAVSAGGQYDDELAHFKCFGLAETGGAINEEVKLQTQFGK